VKTSIRQSCTALITGTLLLAFPGCTHLEPGEEAGVQVSRDENADFSQFTTWSWLPISSEDAGPRSETEQRLSARVQQQINRELRGRGFRYRATNADLGIGARLIVEREKRTVNQTTAIQTLSSLHYSSSIQVQATQQQVALYERGRLTIRAIDLRRDRVVWRGVHEARFRDSIEPHVGDVVARTLARFPLTERRDRSLALNSN